MKASKPWVETFLTHKRLLNMNYVIVLGRFFIQTLVCV